MSLEVPFNIKEGNAPYLRPINILYYGWNLVQVSYIIIIVIITITYIFNCSSSIPLYNTNTIRITRLYKRKYIYIFIFVLFQLIWLYLSWTSCTVKYESSKRDNVNTRCDCANTDHVTTSNREEGNKQREETDTTCGPIESVKKVSRTECYLFVMILSSVDGKQRRDAIRHTWMSDYQSLYPKVIAKFSIGTKSLHNNEILKLQKENEEYQDLLILPDLQESYYNLTMKVLHSFIEADRLFDFKYLFKGDDDTYIILSTVLKELSERTSKMSLYWGFFDGRSKPKKGGKWKETSGFVCDYYVPYALGGGYVLSTDLIQRIIVNNNGLQFYLSEDVSVALWLSGFKAERRHDGRFNTEFVSRGCRNSYIVSHKQTTEDMYSKYNNLKQYGYQCEKEFQTRPSYEYNWDVIPSQCCKRETGIP